MKEILNFLIEKTILLSRFLDNLCTNIQNTLDWHSSPNTWSPGDSGCSCAGTPAGADWVTAAICHMGSTRMAAVFGVSLLIVNYQVPLETMEGRNEEHLKSIQISQQTECKDIKFEYGSEAWWTNGLTILVIVVSHPILDVVTTLPTQPNAECADTRIYVKGRVVPAHLMLTSIAQTPAEAVSVKLAFRHGAAQCRNMKVWVNINKMKPTNPNAHTYLDGTDVKTHGFAVTHNTFLQ